MEEKQLLEQVELFIEENKESMVKDIARLVAVRSVEEAPAPGAPYGPGPRKALDTALAIAADLGFEGNDGDGHVGWIELPGREKGHIATITHVDIVPEGEGWDSDPLVLRREGDCLLARGVEDDKGPTVLCLYLARFFAGLPTPLRYGLRVLLGTNEETGMNDVKYYNAHYPAPLFCFSPDATFPVCNGEKGHFGGTFVSAAMAGNLVRFAVGTAPNVIPGKADCVVKVAGGPPPATANVAVQMQQDGTALLTATGVAGHAAYPEGTQNAIGVLVQYLLEQKLCSAEEEQFLQLLHRMHSSAYGEGLGIACSDDMFHALTINGGIISLQDGVMTQSIDIRYPTATTGQALRTALAAAAAQHGAQVEFGRYDEPFYISPDAPTIQALATAYNDVTGRVAPPYTSGGGTYARYFKNAVSFGPNDLEAAPLPEYAGNAHAANEGALLSSLLRAMKIYALAIWRLQKVDFAVE